MGYDHGYGWSQAIITGTSVVFRFWLVNTGTYNIYLSLEGENGWAEYETTNPRNLTANTTVPLSAFTLIDSGQIITITDIPNHHQFNTWNLSLIHSGSGNLVGSNQMYIQDSSADFIISNIDPGVYEIVLTIPQDWAEPIRFILSSQNISGSVTISFNDFIQLILSITVTDIPTQYRNNDGSITLMRPGTSNPAGYGYMYLQGSSAEFNFYNMNPGVFDVFMDLLNEDTWETDTYSFSSQRFFGEVTIPFGDFNFIPPTTITITGIPEAYFWSWVIYGLGQL